MNVQLLLLLALAGPFCAFTHASPTALPVELSTSLITEVPGDVTSDAEDVTGAPTEYAKEAFNVITGPPPTEPEVAPAEITEATEAATVKDVNTFAVITDIAVLETEAHTTAAAAPDTPEPVITDHPAAVTEASTEPAETEVQAEGTAATNKEEEVVIEGSAHDGLSSGQVVGIVIGALLAVVIVMAVVIAAVRRMGKYSP